MEEEQAPPVSTEGRRQRLRGFCEKHRIRRLEVFDSVARGHAWPRDVDLLVTFEDSASVSTDELLDMAGEVEEIVGLPVDFVLRRSLDEASNRYARQHILDTAVCIYGS